MNRLGLPTILIALVAFAGCESGDDEPVSKVVLTERPEQMPAWLNSKDKVDPAVWLRSREIGHKAADTDAEVGRLRRAIQQATIRFYEDPRMIANRTAQTGAMLAEAGHAEHFVDIVTGLIDVADVSAARKLYGQMCQQYLNDRKGGLDRSAAIKQLMAAYKNARIDMPKGEIP